MSAGSHAGRTALVTGGGRGLGAAVAQALTAAGARVGLVDVNGADLQAMAAATGAATAVADVADFAALRAAVTGLETALGGPFDILIANAGISPKHDGRPHLVFELDPAEWQRVLDVNLTGAFNAVRLTVPAMKARGGGAILAMASVAGRTYTPLVGAHYAASKAALIGMTRHLAGELGPFGITVNALAPGRIETPMIRTMATEVNAEIVRTTPLRRLGTPAEVADAALFLTSPQARFVTGQVLDVAGGFLMT